MRKLKKFTSVVMFVALFDATVNQVLFWTTEQYHTPAIATRIGSGALLAFASLILLTTIWNYQAIEKESA
jgi:hypothetical protein